MNPWKSSSQTSFNGEVGLAVFCTSVYAGQLKDFTHTVNMLRMSLSPLSNQSFLLKGDIFNMCLPTTCIFLISKVYSVQEREPWLRGCLQGVGPRYNCCLDATDLKLSQLIWPAARGRPNVEMIRLGVWHIPYSSRDVQGLLLASA